MAATIPSIISPYAKMTAGCERIRNPKTSKHALLPNTEPEVRFPTLPLNTSLCMVSERLCVWCQECCVMVSGRLCVWCQEGCVYGVRKAVCVVSGRLCVWCQEGCLCSVKNAVCMVSGRLFVKGQECCVYGVRNAVCMVVRKAVCMVSGRLYAILRF